MSNDKFESFLALSGSQQSTFGMIEMWNTFLDYLIGVLNTIRCNCNKVETTTVPNNIDDDDELVLTYFDVPGLAQSIRNTFTYGEVEFVDERIAMDDFKERKDALPFGQVPVLRINEDTFAQSQAILRYASRKVRTYPTNAKNALHIDQWCDFHVDFMFPLCLNMYPESFGTTVNKNHRKWCLDVHIPKFLSRLDDNLKDGEWIGGMDSLSMADMCWYPTLIWLVDKFDGFEQSDMDKYTNIVRFMADMEVQLEEAEEEEEEEEDLPLEETEPLVTDKKSN